MPGELMSAAMVSRFQSELLRAIDGRTNVSVNASTTFTTLEFTNNLLARMPGSIMWPAEIVAHVATYETVTGASVDEMHRIANTIQQGPINISTSNSTWCLSISANGNASYRIADHRAAMAANRGDVGVSTGLTVGLVVVAFVCVLTVGFLFAGRRTKAEAPNFLDMVTPVYEASQQCRHSCLETKIYAEIGEPVTMRISTSPTSHYFPSMMFTPTAEHSRVSAL